MIIGVVGATGTGKTTFIVRFCNIIQAIPIFEEWQNNPYMSDFYKSKNLFKNQMWFTKNDISRMHKAVLLSQAKPVVIDKLFIQNYAYNYITELSIHEKSKCLAYFDNFKHLLC